MGETGRELAERGQLFALAQQDLGALDAGAHQRQHLARNRRQLGDEIAKRLAAENEEPGPPRRAGGPDVRKVNQETEVAGKAAGWQEVDLGLTPLDQLGDAQLSVEDDVERLGGIAFVEEDGATIERGLDTTRGQPSQVAVGERGKDRNVTQLVRRHPRRGRPWIRRHRRHLLLP